MIKRLVLALALATTTVRAANASDRLTLQLLWVTQAQFAGYYVAKDKGFYRDVNLDVTIKPGGQIPTIMTLLLRERPT